MRQAASVVGVPCRVGLCRGHLPCSSPQAFSKTAHSSRGNGRVSRTQRVAVLAHGVKSKERSSPGGAAQQVSEGLPSDLAAAQQRLQSAGVSLGKVTAISGLVGVTFGFLFQITHNVSFLPAWTIPVLLAPIWLLYGYAQPVLDEYFGGEEIEAARCKRTAKGLCELAHMLKRASSLTFVAACWATLAAQFLLSDLLYQVGAPHWVCSTVLAALAFAIWRKFDNTKSGAILAALLTPGAPAGEVLIVNFLHLWHYTRPDLFGVPHWAGWCYATYAIGVGNVGRYLVEKNRKNM